MKETTIIIIILLLYGIGIPQICAQTTSASSNLVAQAIPDRTVSYSVKDLGVFKPIIWGLDLAWLSESNVKRGLAFMGSDQVDLIRSSFTPTAPLVNNQLQAAELNTLNQRLNIIDLLGSHTKVVLNCDHPSVNSWFKGNASNWAQLIEVTTRLHEAHGRTVVTVSPFNEPDYSATGQGNVTDFYSIIGVLRSNSYFDNIRISGGNTLNCDQALPWYNQLKDRLDEGNTHQLAGSFDNYAGFYQTVRANGDHATNDELHNVMEAMVGSEYGMQSGIWWGTAELARGEFVKATDGVRLGYAEHRPNWTAASVYRHVNGKVQAFGGTSERQAVTTTYRYVSKDRDVYYDGYGPQREYSLVLPGGTGYQQGQTNAERVVNITWGEDIQPVINGRYVLVNRNSGKVMEVAGGSMDAGANLQQGSNTGAAYQQWDVNPVDSRVGGDFSYFTLANARSGKSPDILNFSLDNGANVIVWDNVKSGNQQWYLDYAEDGWFYIRSRHSAKCLDVDNASTAEGANVFQWDKLGGTNQQWRFLPVGAPVEFTAPSAPNNLVAKANAESIALNWTASSETDLEGYTIFRSESAGGVYSTIARNVKTISFVDNSVLSGTKYFYKIKAVDKSLNRSNYSNEVSATATGENNLVASLQFDGNTLDNSINFNQGATYGSISYTQGKIGSGAITLNGANSFVQLPATLANQQEITVATWVYWNGGSSWQRIFDFGNGENENMFLSPSSGSSQLLFSIKNGGVEQSINAPALSSGVWSHVAVTLSATGASMYVNGKQVAESNAITISPLDFKPVLNYIGRSQFSDPLLNGRVDDFRVYNYALTADEIAELSLPNDNVIIEVIGETCPDKNNGQIKITAKADLNYSIRVNGTPYVFTNKTFLLTNLAAAKYDICVAVTGTNFVQCYAVEIPKSSAVSGKTVVSSDKLQVEIQSGTAPYQIVVNGELQFETNNNNFEVVVKPGDILEVKTAKVCEGKLSKTITLFDTVRAFPNPTSGQFDIYLPTNEDSITIGIYSADAKLISTSDYPIENGKVHLNIEKEPTGIYFVKVQSNPAETIQIIKK